MKPKLADKNPRVKFSLRVVTLILTLVLCVYSGVWLTQGSASLIHRRAFDLRRTCILNSELRHDRPGDFVLGSRCQVSAVWRQSALYQRNQSIPHYLASFSDFDPSCYFNVWSLGRCKLSLTLDKHTGVCVFLSFSGDFSHILDFDGSS